MTTNTSIKLWQLNSILEGNLNLAIDIARSNNAWSSLADLCSLAESKRAIGDWISLEDQNTELPIGFAQAILSQINKYCYLSKTDGHLRSYKFKPDDEPLSYLECFNRYGGTLLEDTLEKSSYYLNSINGYKP